ncbi:MAG: hypothetical protein N5P05_001300 [Chroococcopsis gigantea SAG 12.99]|nr:hypothetical protein [Chroococcopsis gigantea SAG 12.99]
MASIFILLLPACAASTPPREFSPGGAIVQKAILLQLQQTQSALGDSLQVKKPGVSIKDIKVKSLDPVYVSRLAAYHLQGTYKLTIKPDSQPSTQQVNEFDLYLQRQIEGKSWRLLKREVNPADSPEQWKSYLVN